MCGKKELLPRTDVSYCGKEEDLKSIGMLFHLYFRTHCPKKNICIDCCIELLGVHQIVLYFRSWFGRDDHILCSSMFISIKLIPQVNGM